MKIRMKQSILYRLYIYTFFMNLMSLSRAAGKVNRRGTPMHAGEDAEKMVGVAAEAFMELFDDLVDRPYFFCKTGQ